MGWLVGLIPGAQTNPLVLLDLGLGTVLVMAAGNIPLPAWRWMFRLLGGVLIGVGVLTGLRR